MFGGGNKPLFGQSQPTTGGGLFGQTQTQQPPSLFGNTNNNNNFGATNTGGIFGATQPQQPVFGANNNGFNNPTAQGTGLFGGQQPQQTGGIFGGQPQQQTQGLFGGLNQTQPQNTLFGQQPQQQQGGMFGNTNPFGGNTNPLATNPLVQPQQQPNTGLFGGGGGTDINKGGVFGQTNNTSTGGGLFGQTQNTTTGNGLFGGLNQQNNQNKSLFGNNTNTNTFGNTNTGGIFGNTSNTFGNATGPTWGATNPVFGATNNTAFGNNTTIGNTNTNTAFGNTTSNNGGLFGSNNTTFGNNTNNTATFGTNNANSIFGSTTPAFGSNQTGSMFGQPAFGQNTTFIGGNNIKKYAPSKPRNETLTKQKNVLVGCITTMDEYHSHSKEELRVQYIMTGGQPPAQQVPSFGNTAVFGNTALNMSPNNTTNSSIFGNPATNNASMTLFGKTQPTTGSIFGQPANNATTSIFGQTNTQPQTTSIFGQPANTSGSIFGQTQPTGQTGTLFGQTQQPQTSLFNQPNNTLFGQPAANNNGPLFGNPNNTLFPNNNSNTQGTLFNSPQQSGNVFGNQFGMQPQMNPSLFQDPNQFPGYYPYSYNQYDPYSYNPIDEMYKAFKSQKNDQSALDAFVNKLPVPPGYKIVKKQSNKDSLNAWEELKEKSMYRAAEEIEQKRNKERQRQLLENKWNSDYSNNNSIRKYLANPDQEEETKLQIKYIKPNENYKKKQQPVLRGLKLDDQIADDKLLSSTVKTTKQKQTSEIKFADPEDVPVCNNYVLSPSITTLSRYTKEQLKSVNHFKISNKYGSIEFEEPVDLLKVNVDEAVSIEADSIEIINKTAFEVGHHKILLTYKNFGRFTERMAKAVNQKQAQKKKEKFLAKMNIWIEESDMELIEFNQSTATLKVKV